MNPSRPFELPAFLRALFLILSAGLYTALLGPLALVSCFLDRSRRWPSLFQGLWVDWLLRTNGIPVRVEGMQNLKKDQSYILVSNHASILDIPALISAAPFPVRFLAKKSLLWFPIFGQALYFSGHILVDRKSAQSALRGLKKAPSLLKKGISIIVFPEGTRTPDGEMKEFKRGAFLLAQHSKFPIVPVSINGSYEMLPRHGWCYWPGTIQIRMSEPIPTRDLSHQELRDLMSRVRETVLENLKRGRVEQEVRSEERGERPDDRMKDAGGRVQAPQC
ncbi:MAG: lysophospholipid acyltransferase family protein [Planctomycetaceae bacterium]